VEHRVSISELERKRLKLLRRELGIDPPPEEERRRKPGPEERRKQHAIVIVVASRNPIREEASRCRIYIPLLCTPSDPKIRVAAGIFRSNAAMEPRWHRGVALVAQEQLPASNPSVSLGHWQDQGAWAIL
jgi:hypothetical protein